MGKGDKKSRRGKIIIGSFGVRRPKSSKNKTFVKTGTADSVAVVKTKKVAEKPKTDPKPKTKVAEPVVETVVVVEPEVPETPKKVVKKAVKKTKDLE